MLDKLFVETFHVLKSLNKEDYLWIKLGPRGCCYQHDFFVTLKLLSGSRAGNVQLLLLN